MRACHYQTASVETRQAVHMAQSQQLSAEDLHIQSATMSGTEKLALSADSNSTSAGSVTREWKQGAGGSLMMSLTLQLNDIHYTTA